MGKNNVVIPINQTVMKMNKRRLLGTLLRIEEETLTESELVMLKTLMKDPKLQDTLKQDMEDTDTYKRLIERQEEHLVQEEEKEAVKPSVPRVIGPGQANPLL